MAVEPNSILRVYKEVPLNDNYENTIWFESTNKQLEYFNSLDYKTYNKMTYQRVSSNTIRISEKADVLRDYNYMSFMNTEYLNRWFYAFIVDVRYINENACEIDYDIDVIQSYLYRDDVELMSCFVEREHSATDAVGDNIIHEDLDVGEWRCGDTNVGTGLFDDYTIALIANYQRTIDDSGPIVQRYYSKLYMADPITRNPIMLANHYYGDVKPTTDPSSGSTCVENAYTAFFLELQDLIQGGYSVSPDDLVVGYFVPTKFVPIHDYYPPQRAYGLPTGTVMVDYKVADHIPTALGSYGTPRNKKLLTFQFNKLVCNSLDDKHEYAYEFFNPGEIHFSVYANLCTPVSFQACPNLYKGQTINKIETVVVDNFPIVPFGVSNYQQWLNRNGARLGVQGLMSIGSAALGVTGGAGRVLTGSQMLTPKTKVLSKKGQREMIKGYDEMFSGATEGVGGVLNCLATANMMLNTGSDFHGTPTGNLEMATKRKDFYFYQQYPEKHYAAMIDDFFDMYGYATNAVKVPNTCVRNGWTYTKTTNCMIKGGAPDSALNKICGIFNKGIRFWRKPEYVGLYQLNNTPLNP